MTVEMFVSMPFAEDYKKLAANPDGFPALVEKLIALEKEPMAWEADVKAMKTPVLIITGDADVATLEHSVAMFRLLGGGAMGDMGKPLAGLAPRRPAGDVAHRRHHPARPAPRLHRALPQGRDAEGVLRAVGGRGYRSPMPWPARRRSPRAG